MHRISIMIISRRLDSQFSKSSTRLAYCPVISFVKFLHGNRPMTIPHMAIRRFSADNGVSEMTTIMNRSFGS